MTIHSDSVELTDQPNLWRVPPVRFGETRIIAQDLPGLDPAGVDLQRDEDALVRVWPGEPMYCYRCKVTSNDSNPMLREVPKFAEPIGIPGRGCEHIDAVTQEIVQRCQAGERRRR